MTRQPPPADDAHDELRIEVNGSPYFVRVVDEIPFDPEAIGFIDSAQSEILLLRAQSLPCALRTLAHEVGHAWLGSHPEIRLPSSIESFCESFADVIPKFVEEFTRQGGSEKLARMMAAGAPREAVSS